MRVWDIATRDPVAATPDTPLNELAFRMIQYRCGAIPIVDNLEDRHLLGIITDRDIIARAVSQDRNPMSVRAEDVMTLNVRTVGPETPVTELCTLFRARKFRRAPVVDADGRLVGIVSLTDLALRMPPREPGVDRTIREVVASG